MSERGEKPNELQEIARRYQVVQKLGAGAFGTVYKAKDKILGRMVAIKTIRFEGLAASGGISQKELTERFLREAQVSAQLRHPNIVTVYDVGESEGMSYLAMEFIDGKGLDRVIATERRLSVERAASIGAQVADALGFAHEHHVVHRDVKPANIMIEGEDRVKVTDFGIAKVTTATDQLTVTGSLLGTPSYMSPEQARGQTLDGRSDLFAVGSILYEMVVGARAFKGDSITGLIFRIITEEPQPIKELDPQIPDDVVRIIQKALAKTPAARYQSGAELAADLLELTREGVRPTIRVTETPTTPGLGAPAAAAVGSTPTVASPTTGAAAAPTLATPGRAAPPPAPRPVPPPPPSAAPAPVGSLPPPPAATARGHGAGALVGLAVGALGLAALAAGAVWYFALRESPETVQSASVAVGKATAPPETSAPHDGVSPASAPPSTAAVAPPPTVAAPVQSPPASTAPRTQSRPTPRPVSQFAFLDKEPLDPSEGTDTGQNVADAYRSSQGGTRGYGTGPRLRRRARSPRRLAPAERPAVAALRHLINAEETFYGSQERYGNLEELNAAGILRVDVPFSAEGFTRKGYRFELTLEPDGFRAVARPETRSGRAFVGDDTGFIRPGIE